MLRHQRSDAHESINEILHCPCLLSSVSSNNPGVFMENGHMMSTIELILCSCSIMFQIFVSESVDISRVCEKLAGPKRSPEGVGPRRWAYTAIPVLVPVFRWRYFRHILSQCETSITAEMPTYSIIPMDHKGNIFENVCFSTNLCNSHAHLNENINITWTKEKACIIFIFQNKYTSFHVYSKGKSLFD